MTTVTRATISTTPSITKPCPCGWGKHCRCLHDWHFARDLERAVRSLLTSGGDLSKRRRAHEAMLSTVEVIDQRERDTRALRGLYKVLPRHKDLEIVHRLVNDDRHSGPWTDEQIADRMRAPLEHVRTLRGLIAAAYDGRPLALPRGWRAAARARRAKVRAMFASRSARSSEGRAA
jgi:hypothetical protein